MKAQDISTNAPYTYETLLKDLSRLLIEFPFIERTIPGYSVLGKPIYCLKFGKGTQKIIITAAHHGMEWITSMLVMRMLFYLCHEYESGDTQFYDKNTICFVPMVNPDGVNLSIRGLSEDLPIYVRSRLLKITSEENFINNWQANIRGIDLNHNYDASFALGKSIQIKEGIIAPAPTKYSGEYPESEPETKAIVSLTKKFSPHIVIAYHSQGEEIFYKYQGKCAPDAEEIANRLAQVSGYDLILAEGLTDCTGYKDWVIEKFNIPAFTVEVGKGKNPLPLSQFDKIFSDNLKLIKAI